MSKRAATAQSRGLLVGERNDGDGNSCDVGEGEDDEDKDESTRSLLSELICL